MLPAIVLWTGTNFNQENNNLMQFWHSLNGLASRCELREITQTLVHDVFILNMNNKKVQEKLSVEPNDNPQDAIQYAISYEEGIKRQKSMGVGVAESSKVAVKSERVYAMDRANKRMLPLRCRKFHRRSHKEMPSHEP